jgi:hypothetical protein
VDPDFLDLLADNDDNALLVLIHWCAIMHRSNNRTVYAWAYRTTWYAINRLHNREQWTDLLVWPLHAMRKSESDHDSLTATTESLNISVTSAQEDTLVLPSLAHMEKFPVDLRTEPGTVHRCNSVSDSTESSSPPSEFSTLDVTSGRLIVVNVRQTANAHKL